MVKHMASAAPLGLRLHATTFPNPDRQGPLGSSIPDVALAVQRRVRDYLMRMADIEAPTVNVVIDEVGEPG